MRRPRTWTTSSRDRGAASTAGRTSSRRAAGATPRRRTAGRRTPGCDSFATRSRRRTGSGFRSAASIPSGSRSWPSRPGPPSGSAPERSRTSFPFSPATQNCPPRPTSPSPTLDLVERQWHKSGALWRRRGGRVAELLGTHSYQLDPKGRISLPARFRAVFADGAVLTLGQDGCLFCFPKAEWEGRAAEVRDRPLSDARARAYARMFFGKAEPVDLDAQGRLTIPQRLRSEAGIHRDAVIVGVYDRMEVWDRSAHDRYEQTHGGAYQAGTLDIGGEG
ncbi:MAG: division/cell wall cluster transcriptional repressor MraZ [Actinobacteria bacterium]|nr:MAG: division/cell wall cluster transcriptional repressor MraZ [Actinomycetota bacterium]